MIAWRAVTSVLVWTAGLAQAATPVVPNADRVAVLITDWAEPEGFDAHYRRTVVSRSFGARALRPDEPCTENFVGQFPFRSQIGLVPFAVAFETKGLEGVYDSMGLYRRSADGATYTSIVDPSVTIAAQDLPPTPGLVRPARDIEKKPLSRSFWALDPRDDTNYLDGVYQIGRSPVGRQANPLAFPNGIRDADEYSYAAAITDFGILHEDQTPRLSPATQQVEQATIVTLQALFGDRIEVRHGAYAAFPPHTRVEDDVALELAKEGFRRMVLARETTDNNNYANNFMTKGYIERALCQGGYGGQIEYQQARQVGRTPEYNLALLHIAKQNLDNIPQGAEVAVLYTTYGLPFPGSEAPGPFAAPHPWAAEVYHENAYNNYIAFKRYLEAYFGDRYQFAWNPRGRAGDLRTDNYYSYGIFTPADSNTADPALRFRTLRENIDIAKQDGRKEVLVVLSHWYYNGRDPLLAIRVLQDIPLQTRDEVRDGQLWKLWCERRDASTPVPCDADDPDVVRLQYTETFDRWAREFGIGYAHRIRGAVERFGVLPTTVDLEIAATGPIDRVRGGTVRVARGALRGTQLTVPPDAYPEQPERFTIKDHRVFNDPADNMVSAWDDFDAHIGTQRVPVRKADDQGRRVSAAVLLGPYRTLFNRPATVTIPVQTARKPEPARLRAFIYNEVSEDWEPVLPPAGSPGLRYDAAKRSVSFETQVLGVFLILEAKPGWTPRWAVKNLPVAALR